MEPEFVHNVIHNVPQGASSSGRRRGKVAMLAIITAVFFAGATVFAVHTISRSFAGSVERIDALFAQYRAMGDDRVVTGQMRPVVRFYPAPAPDFAPRNVVALPLRAGGGSRISPANWRAAA